MAQICYLNGEFLPLADAKVPVLDRGFIFGDGVYEVVPAYGRALFRLPEHLARLAYSLGQVRIANPHDAAAGRSSSQTVVDRNPWDDQSSLLPGDARRRAAHAGVSQDAGHAHRVRRWRTRCGRRPRSSARKALR